MTANGWTQILFFFAATLFVTAPMGSFLYKVLEGRDHFLKRPLGWLERLVYRLCGVDGREQTWKTYAGSLLAFSTVTLLVTYAILRLQHLLPFNPQGMGAVEASSAFNTAVSFTTNTNWQGYSGETTMSYLSQMAGLAWHNFISAAAGIAVAVALARGLTRHGDGKTPGTIGNFWVDVTRATVYVLLPISFVVSLVFVSQGMIQNLTPYREVVTVEGREQVIAMGPVASQEAIKQLGTNGGGYFNANAAHPFENPNPLTNFLSLFLIFVIPAGLTPMFGRMARDPRQGWALFTAMAFLFFVGTTVAYWAESSGNPVVTRLGVAPGLGNMEGKEVRFGVANSALYATVTTDASCGAVNSMHDSFTPLGGLVPLWLMQFGEVVFGGVGSGLYGMLAYAIVAVFIGGLMIGRTPEYLGKKVEAFEMKMAALTILIPAALILLGTAIACLVPAGTATLGNPGVHGFSEILYAFTSGAANNGSAFGGITVSGRFYAVSIAIAMFVGRYWLIIPVLAIAGSLAKKNIVPRSAGTLPTHGPLFIALLAGTVVLVGALTFFPALALGPIVEHLQLHSN